MLRKLYQRVLALAASRKAPAWLAVIAFAESSVFPIPPDVVLAPMVLARPDRAYFYAAICTTASVLGGILGYAIGYFATGLAAKLLAVMGDPGAPRLSTAGMRSGGLWVILIGRDADPLQVGDDRLRLAAFNSPFFCSPRSSRAPRDSSWWPSF
jgi:membrane protein YqaA with SNARE-associated domain